MKFLIPDFAEAAAFFARAVRRIEREQTRVQLFERASAIRAAHLGAHHGQFVLCIEQVRRAATDIERALREIPRFRDSFLVDHAHDNRDGVFFETFQSLKLRDRNELAVDE